MQNITPEHYKKAIREKYEKEKNGDNSYYLEVPSQAKLRDLCWKIFLSNDKKDDLYTFSGFFKSEFDPAKEAAFNQYVDKFRPIGSFLKGEKEPANFYAVELASILVDFELRPFSKFRKHFNEEESVSAKGSLLTVSDLETEEKFKNEDVFENNEVSLRQEVNTKQVYITPNETLNFTEDFSKKWYQTIKRATWLTIGVIAMLLGGCYYFSQKKECMQWSNDHYEEVSCDLKVQGTGAFNKVEPLDKSTFDLKKIKVTDKTIFFKNGEAIVWYAKTTNGIEFFNTHGRHPENHHALRPVTEYIINKYVKK